MEDNEYYHRYIAVSELIKENLGKPDFVNMMYEFLFVKED
jgi:hypothetical protein